ncbi:glutamate-1-semialdehyde 2,1-aminomutase [Nitratidesulfovibrio vulgaris]|jgi:glutamate-1-semialdehyde 2,1-aminomutase|uniref:Glutamate-1-semialdehyde 2,1-aminomutase n=1 Tax=Nitratidesulfovibrio vulgaris (strain ATCC 29579 / DSM 644 / CCUG 34227 / NCIMB 8303 / VKM B-1760 / Hildenborough) TaxID=882 RepID=GSA_NITV2|nr:glutamate-1-semialdehyde 2,1-aminomutase [Nitratidesulfovibrio vulgaris]Q725I1.1 RecName: Full=Glutamate-1-semialdehyde 2,1-aminomutase; Short=GSA; AltName: Full=Glutamate-1-semialdehyde aminotransferase; Short=GSA-AT [Nitratidesulfovibrio vulgaris str. Hildenborough]AAS97638.1 glutamate-1-semialdehyde-2,1-aminomutase [Nitratidesulfovibrio vulgaris str. Hildenborough]ADP88067.1 glutamate-1-semialdehyde-2,1-aminomutase [Nitratidesulfovibrio vulgaris RCH1]
MSQRSSELFERAQQLIPGGVNSPVRACLGVDSEPLFIARAAGSRLHTVDGETFIDFVESWGPMLLGHTHPEVTAAVHAAVDRGTSYGAPCEDEVVLAAKVVDALPGVDMVRMVNSGTEATMSALRLARGYTGRTKLVKFVGCYHGHADPFLASAGSGVATLSIPGTPGVPESTVRDTLLAPYNDLAAVKDLFALHGKDIAAIIVEAVAGNMGLVPPKAGFLEGLRELCDQHGALLIFDEVITGFRVSFGGAQQRFGITPDLTTLGKIIGGGLPVGAYGGKREIMQRIAPCGEVYQAGTLSGNPLAMAAGIATLDVLSRSDYAGLEARVAAFVKELEAILKGKGVPVRINTLASMFTVFFTNDPVTDFASAKTADGALYTSFYKQMRAQGIYLAPSPFEAAMVSFAHTDDDLAAMLDAARKVTF